MGSTVLVVDDDEDLGDCAAELLAVAGHAALVARNGEQALLLAHGHHIDAVLLDWDLPGALSGVPLVGALREATGAPIIVCSADPRSFDEARPASPSAVLSKPYSYPALIETIAGA